MALFSSASRRTGRSVAHQCQVHEIQVFGQANAGMKPANSDRGHIHAFERYGGLQAVPQRIASIVGEMRPNLMLDGWETITGTRMADVFAPAWSIIEDFAVWRSTRFPKGFLRLVRGRSVSIGKRTSDNGVHVHEKRVSMCTAATPVSCLKASS